MRGVIWEATHNSAAADALFDQLVDGYRLLGRNVRVFKGNTSKRFSVDNGDYWTVASATESARGNKCNISYVERGIPSWIVREIIMPSTCCLPFKAITYFGEYGLIGDDYECLITG